MCIYICELESSTGKFYLKVAVVVDEIADVVGLGGRQLLPMSFGPDDLKGAKSERGSQEW